MEELQKDFDNFLLDAQMKGYSLKTIMGWLRQRVIIENESIPMDAEVGMPSENSFGQWIDVKDKLPEDANPVLIKLTNNPIMYGNMHTYLGDRYWLIWRSNGTYKENPTYRVTHWMPLPEPPKQ